MPTPARRKLGAGQHLKRRLGAVGIVASPNCACNAMALKMDTGGPAWCREHVAEIVAVMKAEAAQRRLPFIESGARWIIRQAIRDAERDLQPP